VTDGNSRLKTSIDRSLDEDAARKMNELLNSAKSDFEKAISLDHDYDMAYINLACVFDLMENPEAAIGKIKEMPVHKQNQKKAYRILGIAYYHAGNEMKYREMLEKVTAY
jgi:tetratricopeptide (TPR) repeat protein